MKGLFKLTKEFLLDLVFPKFCLNCEKEGTYLCEDCFYLVDILDSQYCPFCTSPRIAIEGKTCPACQKTKTLSGLYFAADYNNFVVKKLIHQFKYEPYVKDLAKPLADLIVEHISRVGATEKIADFALIPVPLHIKKQKQRGFNQSEELAKELSSKLILPVSSNALIKTKETQSQTELKKEEREKNIKDAFSCSNPTLVSGKKILLVDDIFTTGATMEECSKTLRKAGAKEVWGIAVARG